MESDGPLLLCGYETLQDFGLALPLYRSSAASNAWYTHVPAKPFDLGSLVSGFELFHPECPCLLEEAQEVFVGEQARVIFLWNGRIYVDNVYNLLSNIENHRELENYAPISMADLLLYSRSLKFGRGVKRAYRYIRQRFDRRSADRWFSNVLIKQAVKVDLDRMYCAELMHDESSRVLKFTDFLNNIKVMRSSDDKVTIAFPDELNQVLTINQLDLRALTFTRQACRAAGKEVEFCSGAEFTRGLNLTAELPDTFPSPGSVHANLRHVSRGAEAHRSLVIEVSGQGLDIGEALRQAVSVRFGETLQKFGILDGKLSVTFSKGPHDAGFVCALRYSRRGMGIVASGRGAEAHGAMTGAINRARSQMRKILGRGRFDHQRSLGGKEMVQRGDGGPPEDLEG